ncbi:unnamed protein product, partial [Acidithrix sp. C25]
VRSVALIEVITNCVSNYLSQLDSDAILVEDRLAHPEYLD